MLEALAFALTTAGCMTSKSPGWTTSYLRHTGNVTERKSIAYSFVQSGSRSLGKAFYPTASTPGPGAWCPPQPEAEAIRQFRRIFSHAAKAINPTLDPMGGNCDIMMEIHQQNAFNPLSCFPAMLCGATFMLCPCWGDDVYHLNAKVRSRDGKFKEYLISRTVTTTAWAPLIFAAPFCEFPIRARDSITTENWKELLSRMESDGFFDREAPAEKIPLKPQRPRALDELEKLRTEGVLTQEEYINYANRLK